MTSDFVPVRNMGGEYVPSDPVDPVVDPNAGFLPR